MLSSRTKAFRKLDMDGNNLLPFEEWAAKTSDRFAGADADANGKLTAAEFATTAPKRSPRPTSRCRYAQEGSSQFCCKTSPARYRECQIRSQNGDEMRGRVTIS